MDVALLSPPWKAAMEHEYAALIKNGTWSLVPFASTINVVGNKWIFRIKMHLDGTIHRYKARLVTKGFHQTPGIDFFETSSPVVKASTIWIVLTIVVSYGWSIRQLDFNNAFLNGHLDEEVFMQRPPGFVDPHRPAHICKLNKAIYGLKLAPRAWNITLENTLLFWGFQNAQSYTSLFIRRAGMSITLLLVYVDDVLITGFDSRIVTNIIQQLDSSFALKDLGQLKYFLGLQVHYLPEGILLNQSKYVSDLLTKLQLEHLNPALTPTVIGKQLSLRDGTPLADPFVYRSTIGALQYLTHTRPDIAYAVNHLSQFLNCLTDSH